jgi:hypothetical protein
VLEKIPHKIHLKFVDGTDVWYTNEDLTSPSQIKSSKPVKKAEQIKTDVAQKSEQKPAAKLVIPKMSDPLTNTERAEIKKELTNDLTFTFQRFRKILRYILKHKYGIILESKCKHQDILDAFNNLPAAK